MNFINPPTESPQNVTHKTYYSQLVNHEVGYNIYLPPDYGESGKRYPAVYHLHGYKGNESSDIWTLEKVNKNREAITVFANGTSSDNGYLDNELPIESIILISTRITKRTQSARVDRSPVFRWEVRARFIMPLSIQNCLLR